MLKISRALLSINTVLHAWSSLKATKSFFGMTFDQYSARMQPCFEVRAEIAETRKRLRGLIAKRKDVDAEAFQVTKNVVHSVRADPTEGESSPFYAALGYVRPGERRARRMRNANADASPRQREAATPPSAPAAVAAAPDRSD